MSPFRPEKATQSYCSIECAEAAIAKQKQWNDVLTPVANVIELEYLTFSKAATLMGCSRQYVYKLVATGKLPASRLSNRMSFIRRKDIETMLQGNPYYRVLPVGIKRKKKETINQLEGRGGLTDSFSAVDTDLLSTIDCDKYITLEEAMAKYNVSNTTIYNKVKAGNVPVCSIANKTYYDRPLLDKAMSIYLEGKNTKTSSGNNADITPIVMADDDIEWILIKDCATLYNKTPMAMKTFAYRYEIPAKWINGKRYYSKTHLDARLKQTSDDGNLLYHIRTL